MKFLFWFVVAAIAAIEAHPKEDLGIEGLHAQMVEERWAKYTEGHSPAPTVYGETHPPHRNWRVKTDEGGFPRGGDPAELKPKPFHFRSRAPTTVEHGEVSPPHHFTASTDSEGEIRTGGWRHWKDSLLQEHEARFPSKGEEGKTKHHQDGHRLRRRI